MAEERCPYCGREVERTDKVCPHCQKRITASSLLADPPGGGAPVPAVPVGVPTSTSVLLLFAVGLGGLGFLMLSEATRGVGMIALGCLLAVWGRIFQAAAIHRDAVRRGR